MFLGRFSLRLRRDLLRGSLLQLLALDWNQHFLLPSRFFDFFGDFAGSARGALNAELRLADSEDSRRLSSHSSDTVRPGRVNDDILAGRVFHFLCPFLHVQLDTLFSLCSNEPWTTELMKFAMR